MKKLVAFILVLGFLGFSQLPGYSAGDKITWLKNLGKNFESQITESNKSVATKTTINTPTKAATETKENAGGRVSSTEQPKAPQPSSKELTIHVGDTRTKELEQAIFKEINARRVAAKCKPLIWDEKMAELARLRAVQVLKAKYFDHNLPPYGNSWDMLKQFGISYKYCSEVASQSTVLDWQNEPSWAAEGWFKSIGHRTILTDPALERAGVGVAWVDQPVGIYIKPAKTTKELSVSEFVVLYTPK